MRDEELKELKPELIRTFKILQKNKVNTLREAVDIVSKNENIRWEEAAKRLYILWKKGYIDIEDLDEDISLVKYITGVEGVWFNILTALIITSLALVFLAETPPLIYFRYIFGSLFVLYLPGYALIEALYPRGDELEPLERVALSIGLSLAIVPLVGLILNYTPWGIRLTPITISLALLTEALLIYSLIKKYNYYKLRKEVNRK